MWTLKFTCLLILFFTLFGFFLLIPLPAAYFKMFQEILFPVLPCLRSKRFQIDEFELTFFTSKEPIVGFHITSLKFKL